ncbi:MAG: sodium ion-translocating decarboxylase subunit beta [Gemmiger sp.]
MNKVKKYMYAVQRRLRMDRRTRRRVMADLSSSVQSRLDDGRSIEEIQTELGTPEQAAAELNEAFREQSGEYKSPWRWLFLALAVLAACAAPLCALLADLSSEAASVGIIGGADGPTAIYVAGKPDAGMVAAPWIAGFVGLFLLLGWCRESRRRLWVPAVVCGSVTVWWLVAQAMSIRWMAGTGMPPGSILADTVFGLLTGGVWLCAAVLARSLFDFFHKK